MSNTSRQKVGLYSSGSTDERFELIQFLGKGAFAHTYKARVLKDPMIETYGTDTVALKIPLNLEKEQILKREVELNVRLHMDMTSAQSSNLVRYLGFDIFDNQNVMVMEFIKGGSLRDIIGKITQQKCLPVEQAVYIAMGILRGIVSMHEAHVFHRDIKPENILIDNGQPKISDFGIARMLNPNELASSTAGTLYYMSPQVLFDDGASFSSDIWSVGVTFYEMLTGKLPFYHSAHGRVMELIREGRFIQANKVQNDIPEELNNIVSKALQKDCGLRFQSAKEMLEELDRFVSGKQVSTNQELSEILYNISTFDKSKTTENKLLSAVKKYSDEPKAYQALGEYYNRCQRYSDAIRVFREGIKANKDSPLLYWDLALALIKINDRHEATKNLEKAIELGLDENRKRNSLILLKKCRESIKIINSNAEKELAEVIEALPILQQESVTEVESRVKDLIKKYPQESRTYQILGEFYNRCQRYLKAISILNDGLKVTKNNALLYWNLAMSYIGIGDRQKAVTYLEKAMSGDLDDNRRRYAVNLLKRLKGDNLC